MAEAERIVGYHLCRLRRGLRRFGRWLDRCGLSAASLPASVKEVLGRSAPRWEEAGEQSDRGCVRTYSLSLAFYGLLAHFACSCDEPPPELPAEILKLGPKTGLVPCHAGKGRGGQNQELALRVWLELGGMALPPKGPLFLSGGTDGQDGPTEAAGAVTDAGLGEEARAQGLDTEGFLINNDSFTFFSHLSGGQRLLLPGLTGNNVMDVHILLIPPIPIVVSGH
ncbi:unnamed protein product [Coregonus sp. 'balchen']|nr:unnamed protein product [Coregonus sp. 'balchen']